VIPFHLLFWNMKSATPGHVAALAKEHGPDVIVLAESAHSSVSLVQALNSVGDPGQYEIASGAESRIQLFAKLPRRNVGLVFDGNYLSIRHIRPVLGMDFILVAAHLPSQLRLDREEQALLCSRWVRDISDAERKVGHHRTVLIGDLNMNPFDSGMVGSEGLHAVSCRAIAARESRTVLREERLFFYNPMWSLLGDHSGVPGTYYYESGGKPIAYFWNMFDQVLLRPELARSFKPGDVSVITSMGCKSLLNTKGVPNVRISDHLPIFAAISLED